MTRSRIFDWLAGPRSTRWLGWATLALVAGTLMIVGRFGPTLLTNSENARRTDDLAACRAEARAEIDAADIRVAEASLALLGANTSVSTALALGLVALQQNDDAAVAAQVSDIQQSSIDALKAKADSDAAIDDLRAAASNYGESVVLSREDPDGFLQACR